LLADGVKFKRSMKTRVQLSQKICTVATEYLLSIVGLYIDASHLITLWRHTYGKQLQER